MASLRHLQRVAVMQAIFSFEVRKEDKSPDEFLEYSMEESSGNIEDFSFAKNLIKGVFSKKEDLEKAIQKYAPKWPLEKIAPIDRAILEIGMYELLYEEDVPNVVVIDEAIEIAKQYGSENSFKFVNGVLSAAMKDVEKQ
jgi:transcription antitermination protein NusB